MAYQYPSPDENRLVWFQAAVVAAIQSAQAVANGVVVQLDQQNANVSHFRLDRVMNCRPEVWILPFTIALLGSILS